MSEPKRPVLGFSSVLAPKSPGLGSSAAFSSALSFGVPNENPPEAKNINLNLNKVFLYNNLKEKYLVYRPFYQRAQNQLWAWLHHQRVQLAVFQFLVLQILSPFRAFFLFRVQFLRPLHHCCSQLLQTQSSHSHHRIQARG